MDDELASIISQLCEHLKYFDEIGVTHINPTPTPSSEARQLKPLPISPEQKPVRKQQETALPAAAPAAQARPVRQSEPVIAGPAIKTVEPQIESRKAAAVQQSSLFGDILGPPQAQSDLPVDKSLEDIRADIGDCTRCKLHQHRTNIVFGEGSPKADLVFVGEGPGADEDATGRPFVGRAGQLLNKIIEAIGMKREECYIANVVKCRPPNNRAPERDEVATCEQFLFRQLALIRPRVIVALGSPAFQCILKNKESITKARGQWRDWNEIKVMPTFHPAFLLRSPDKKREVWEDMKKVRAYLDGKEQGS